MKNTEAIICFTLFSYQFSDRLFSHRFYDRSDGFPTNFPIVPISHQFSDRSYKL